jgi:protein TonB
VETNVKQKRKFTIWHGFCASIAIHAIFGLPFVVNVVAAPPEDPPLLIELQDAAPDSLDIAEVRQSEVEQRKGSLQQPTPDVPDPAKEQSPRQTTPTDEPPMEVTTAEEATHNLPQPAPAPPSRAVEAPPPAPSTMMAPDDNNRDGAREYVPPSRRIAQAEMTEEAYGALVMKKIRDNRVVPDEAKRGRLQGGATVSFVILGDGAIRPETLRVVKSSGQPALDAGALSTIRASAPFPPPPREMTVTAGVAYGPRR